MKVSKPEKRELDRVASTNHHNPHSILGAHPAGEPGKAIVRAFHPDATHAFVVTTGGAERSMTKVHPGGVFEALINDVKWPLVYKIRFLFADGATWERVDPYSFLPTLGDVDLHLVAEGTHERLYEKLGAHPKTIDGVEGTAFAVWAPNAARVSVVGDFNRWDGRIHCMRVLGSSGVWEIFIPGAKKGDLYKFEIKTKEGHLRIKTDPLAFRAQLRPDNSSIIHGINDYSWCDREWMEHRAHVDLRTTPMAVYEVHIGSWMRENDRAPNYREIAPKLAAHVKNLGFTHIELMPVQEYPLDESWGYQVTGYYAPTARYGSPDDFKFFVDHMHRNRIGVILDWVPAHFPKDDFSLRFFDGTPLYEHADPKMAEHPDWGSLIFNYGRHEVRNFLLANALFWLDRFHIDGLRVDAVASMIYLDYSRKEGEWTPNKYGGRENLDAISFIRRLNELVYGRFPGCFTVAEESTSWGGVTNPTYLGGLGFGFKWNMGWMHDTLRYFSKDPVHRKFHHNDLTFSMLYEYTENFINPLSHDEVVHGKGSLLNKMPGDEWRKFANLRLLLAYMYTRPGKKLLFMGTELAPWEEWSERRGLDWNLALDPNRAALGKFLSDLGRLYLNRQELRLDHDSGAFRWIDCNDSDTGVVSFLRYGPGGTFLAITLNLTPIPRPGYNLGVPKPGRYTEILNSDSEIYGGSNVGNLGGVSSIDKPFHGFDHSLELRLPPLGALVLAHE